LLSSAAGAGFSNSNYDNWNSNSNASSHLCDRTYSDTDRGSCQKNKIILKGRWYRVRARRRPEGSKGMKRIGNIYSQIYQRENLVLAAKKARKAKEHQPGVQAIGMLIS
jgi:hypothetical protein